MSSTAGFLGVALFAVGTIVAGSPPSPDAGLPELTRWMGENRSELLLGWLIQGAALVPLLILAFGLGARLWPSERHRLLIATTAASWMSLLIIFGLAELPLVAVIWRSAPFDPSLTRASFDIWSLGAYAGTAVLAAASIGLPTWIGLRSGLLPRWLIAIGAIEVVANIAEVAGILTKTGVNAAGYAGGVAPIAWILWAAGAAAAIRRGAAADDVHTHVPQSR